MMKIKRFGLVVFVFWLAFGLFTPAAQAYTFSLETRDSNNANLQSTFAPGEYIHVNIVLDNREGVAGCAFTLNYPSAVLEAPAIDAEGLPTDAAAIVSVFPFTFIKDGATTKTHRVNEQTVGSLFFSGAEINMTTGGAKYETAGQVVLFMVKFRVKTDATSGSYNFSLNQTQLHNPDAGYGTTDDVNSKAAVPILLGAVDKNHASWNNLSEAYPTLLATMPSISKDFNIANTIPIIQVTQSILNFGYVPPGSYKDLILDVKNIGGGILTGTISACPPFSILSGADYSLGAGESQQVIVRYTASLEEGSQTCSFVFSGGGGIIVQVKGTNQQAGLPWLLLLLGN